jgi:hypothetical protein
MLLPTSQNVFARCGSNGTFPTMFASYYGWLRAFLLLIVSGTILQVLFIAYHELTPSASTKFCAWRPSRIFHQQLQNASNPCASIFSTPKQFRNDTGYVEPVVPIPSFEPGSFDIVVSHYAENLFLLAFQIQSLKAIHEMERYREVRVFVYTKHPEANLAEISRILDTPFVSRLPNRGREGGTFLTHIIKHWDDIGSHTMFIQATMHYPQETLEKVQNFLVAPSEGNSSTGVMSLGYYDECQCTSCHDRWDVSRTWSRIAELYSLLNGALCPRNILLTYLGQIIVSQKRIKSRSIETYEYLQRVLVSDMSHSIHADPRQQGIFNDSRENPYFGHTLERSWMLLWDCNNRTMLETCGFGEGSITNFRTEGAPPEACQCMDAGELHP